MTEALKYTRAQLHEEAPAEALQAETPERGDA